MRPVHALRAFAYGVVAYAVGFAAILAIIYWRYQDAVEWADASLAEVVSVTAWVYHGGHFVGVSGPAPALFGETHNVVREPEMGLPIALVFTIPVVVLLVVGFAHSWRSMGHHTYKRQGRKIGAEIAIGYGITAFVVALWSVETVPVLFGSIAVGPDLGMTVLMMGIIYPVVFGGIGGWLYQGAANEGWM